MQLKSIKLVIVSLILTYPLNAFSVPVEIFDGLADKKDLENLFVDSSYGAVDSQDEFSSALNLARQDINAGRLGQAEKQLKSILATDERHIGAMMMMSELAHRRGQRDEEVRWVELAWEKNPGDIKTGVILTKYYSGFGKHNQSIKILHELRSLNPGNVAILWMLGATLFSVDDYAGAIETFESAAKLQPASPDAYWLLANAHAVAGNYDNAVASLDKALTQDADYIPALFTLGQVRLRMNQSQEAQAVAQKLQEKFPGKPHGYLLLGDIYTKKQLYAEASKSYAEALKREKIAGHTYKLFQAQWLDGDRDTAQQTLLQWLEEHPDDIALRQLLGETYVQTGSPQAAIRQFEAVIEAQPDNVSSLNNLAWLMHMANDPKAVDYAKRAYALAPEKTTVMDTLGWVILDKEPNRGLELIQQAAKDAPQMPSIRFHLAVALEKNNRHQEAREELTRLLEEHQDFPEVENARLLLSKLQKN